jgi:hypothetical protein
MEMELLWENASPSSEFAAQTIRIDVRDYDYLELVNLVVTSATVITTHQIPTDGGYLTYVGYSPDDTKTYKRFYIVDSNGFLEVTGAVLNETTTALDRMIPLKIYGIKGVKEDV